jgi:hypothetical protein
LLKTIKTHPESLPQDIALAFIQKYVPPTIQHVNFFLMSKKFKMMSIKCDVKCDNIVKDNPIDLTSKILQILFSINKK